MSTLMNNMPFRAGDCVVVKSGVTDPDTGTDISGWQGRITAIRYETTTLVDIEWDSITLHNMQASIIALCEQQGLDWSAMGLEANEVMSAEARDIEADVARAKALLEERFGWFAFGEGQGKRIQEVVNSAESYGEMDVLQAWHKRLEAEIRFPFQARVSEYQQGPVRQGDTVKVLDISMLDDNYGTIVAVKHKHGLYELPLCDLEVIEQTSPNYVFVDDYKVWFANR